MLYQLLGYFAVGDWPSKKLLAFHQFKKNIFPYNFLKFGISNKQFLDNLTFSKII
jgi:hypothetical protein